MVDAVILAGSLNEGYLKESSIARYEALIPAGKRPMIAYVVEALSQCPSIDRMVVVGPAADLAEILAGSPVQIVPSTADLMENVNLGVEALPGAEKILVATSDIPLITSEAVESFLQACSQREADLYYPVVAKDIIERNYPNTRRTYVTLREGIFTGGNLFLIRPEIVTQCFRKGQEIVSLRKSPLRLSRLLGVPFLIKFMLRILSLPEAERKVSQILGVRGMVVVSPFAEVGIDVDKPSDLVLVQEALARKGA